MGHLPFIYGRAVTNAAKVRVGAGLVYLAILVALAGWLLYTKANRDARHEQITADYSAALGLRPETVTANLTPAIACWVVAGVAVLSGVVLLAGSKAAD